MIRDLELRLETGIRSVLDDPRLSVVNETAQLPESEAAVRFLVVYTGEAEPETFGPGYQGVTLTARCYSRTDNEDRAKDLAKDLIENLPEEIEDGVLVLNSRYLESAEEGDASDDRYQINAVFTGGYPI